MDSKIGLYFILRLLGSLLAKLKGKWGMRILCISYLLKKINRQSLALNTGKLWRNVLDR